MALPANGHLYVLNAAIVNERVSSLNRECYWVFTTHAIIKDVVALHELDPSLVGKTNPWKLARQIILFVILFCFGRLRGMQSVVLECIIRITTLFVIHYSNFEVNKNKT